MTSISKAHERCLCATAKMKAPARVTLGDNNGMLVGGLVL